MKGNLSVFLPALLRRRCLTLIELLIVISILVLVGGVIGINTSKALKEQRFRTEVDLMVDALRLAQDVMLIGGTDVRLNIKNREQKKGIEYGLAVSDKMPKEWDRLINGSKKRLKAIHSAQFLEQGPFPPPEEGLEIRFFSEGSMMSKGVLRVSTHEKAFVPGALNRAICLRGYPHAITSVPEENEQWVTCEEEGEADFLNRLTKDTVQEISADLAREEQHQLTPHHDEEKNENQDHPKTAHSPS
ncbi:MAG: hypothetical protein WB791_03660 [Waddliaceae bacterium]